MFEVSCGLTRRTLLRGVAAAGAVALVDPVRALARGPGTVFSQPVGVLAGGDSEVVLAPARFALVGVQWTHPERARIALRTKRRGAAWSPWVDASVQGHGPDGPARPAPRFGEPVWSGPADYVQLRSAGRVEGVRLHFVSAPAGVPALSGARAARAFPLAQPVLDAGPGQPPIIARGAWAHGQAPPSHVPEYGTVKLAFVHHSETPNGYAPGDVPAILMSIFDYHRYVRGFFDIAYNFAVDAFGRSWEARAGGIDQAVIGAHAGGYNAESTGIVVLGSFMAVSPSAAAIHALEHLLAWKLSLHGVPALGRVVVEVSSSGADYTPFAPGDHVSLPRVAGHRDGDETSCPGDVLYGELPSIRPRVAALAGRPLRLTIAAPTATVRFGSTVTIGGGLTQLGGGALPGAPLEVQRIGPDGGVSTIAAVSTDPSGAWSFTFTAAQNTLLRALHRPAPAAVSDVVVIAVAPVLTLSLESVAPVQVSGTISPAGAGPVTIDVYRHRRLLARHRTSGGDGQFSASLRPLRPGRYTLIARTPATAQYAAGASPPVAVTIP